MGSVQLEAMREKLLDLIKMGMIVREHHPYFSCPAFMVPKKNGTWRMVVDLRRLNENVEVMAGALPELEMQISRLLEYGKVGQ